jgi:DNA-binding NtrC family response regulator
MAVDKILVASGEPFIRKSIEECLRMRRYAVHGVDSIMEAERLLQRDVFDLVLLSVELPDGAGIDLLERLLARPKRPLVVMLTAAEGMETVAQCMRIGAFDYLAKPFGLNQVELVVRKAEAFQQVLRVNQHLTVSFEQSPATLGTHPSTARLHEQVRKLAPTDATVLIEGEPGAGKTAFARLIHRESARASAPYLEVDCRTAPPEALEAQIFGYERGAHTGASGRGEAHLELADGGTLLLEAVEALPRATQDKLLRFLLTREFERLGSNRPLKADVRIVATVRDDLLAAVERGAFQENLFYRLNVLPLRIPPLRQRGDDAMVIAEALRERLARWYGKEVRLSDGAEAAIRSHPWPGNVRELELAVERAVIALAGGGAITPEHLALGAAAAVAVPAGEPLDFAPIHELERQHIFRAMDRVHGNRTKAADLLGISVRTLRNKLHEYRAMAANTPAGASNGLPQSEVASSC